MAKLKEMFSVVAAKRGDIVVLKLPPGFVLPPQEAIDTFAHLRNLAKAGLPWPTGKELGRVVPATALCTECGVTGEALTDPDEWGDWCQWSACAACCKKWAAAEDLLLLANTETKGTA